jgi:hypothetical protein
MAKLNLLVVPHCTVQTVCMTIEFIFAHSDNALFFSYPRPVIIHKYYAIGMTMSECRRSNNMSCQTLSTNNDKRGEKSQHLGSEAPFDWRVGWAKFDHWQDDKYSTGVQSSVLSVTKKKKRQKEPDLENWETNKCEEDKQTYHTVQACPVKSYLKCGF